MDPCGGVLSPRMERAYGSVVDVRVHVETGVCFCVGVLAWRRGGGWMCDFMGIRGCVFQMVVLPVPPLKTLRSDDLSAFLAALDTNRFDSNCQQRNLQSMVDLLSGDVPVGVHDTVLRACGTYVRMILRVQRVHRGVVAAVLAVLCKLAVDHSTRAVVMTMLDVVLPAVLEHPTVANVQVRGLGS